MKENLTHHYIIYIYTTYKFFLYGASYFKNKNTINLPRDEGKIQIMNSYAF